MDADIWPEDAVAMVSTHASLNGAIILWIKLESCYLTYSVDGRTSCVVATYFSRKNLPTLDPSFDEQYQNFWNGWVKIPRADIPKDGG